MFRMWYRRSDGREGCADLSFSFGWTEMLVVGVVVILVWGPERLSELSRTVRRSLGILRAEMKGKGGRDVDTTSAREAASPEPGVFTDGSGGNSR